MDGDWYLTRFDYERFVALRPALRLAKDAQAFASLADAPETKAVAEALQNGEITALAARAEFVRAACCVGESLLFARGLPAFVAQLARHPDGEDAADLLAAAAAGAKNMESWMPSTSGLVGFLRPSELMALQSAYAGIARRGTFGGGPRKRRRRGGLIPGVALFFRRLFDAEPRAEEMLRPLGELLDQASENGEGIAVVVV